MNSTLRIIGILLILTGAVWILQGINLLPGSFMTGQTQWAIYGAITLTAGIWMVVFASRRR
jgi:hypothetical protein